MARIFTSSIVAAALVLISSPVFAQGAAAGTGPKKRIAVSRFDAIGSFTTQYGGWDVGTALAAQLATELANSGRFIVLERTHLSPALREQQLGLVGVTTSETAAQAGQVLGAQILVQGVVTEFELSASGKGVQVGLGIAGASIGLGGSKETGRVAIDLRLVDATTGAVLQAHKAEARITQKAVKGEVSKGAISIGNTGFDKTALGQAIRDAIGQAVKMITGRMETLPWTGRVVEAGDGLVYVNAGRDANLVAGQRLVVSTVAKSLVDPATGLALGSVERMLGEIEIDSVEDQFSVARPLATMSVSRGDIVRVVMSAPAGLAAAQTSRDRAVLVAATRPTPPSADTLRQTIVELDSAATPAMPAGMYGGGMMPMTSPVSAAGPTGTVAPDPLGK